MTKCQAVIDILVIFAKFVYIPSISGKKRDILTDVSFLDAGDRTRTGTLSPAVDFESTTSTNSITPADITRTLYRKWPGDCKTNLPAESTDAQQAQAAHDGTGQGGPAAQARVLFLKSISSRLAARVPVQAPVPGRVSLRTAAAPSTVRGRLWPGAYARLSPPFFQAKGEKFSDIPLIFPPIQALFVQKNK